ncbi:hypothetical protein D3C80_1851670 [compost metagenome]
MGIELVTGQQPAHRIAPAGHLMEAQGGAAEGEDAALDFHLRETRVARAEVDIRRQHQFDTDGVAVALHRHQQGLGKSLAAEGAPGIGGAIG